MYAYLETFQTREVLFHVKNGLRIGVREDGRRTTDDGRRKMKWIEFGSS